VSWPFLQVRRENKNNLHDAAFVAVVFSINMDVDLFGHLNKTTKSSKKKKRTSSLDEKTETPTENADVKRRKLATTSTAKTQKEEPTKMDVDSNSSKTKTIIHRHKLKGGAGTQSKNCVHEVALPPNSSLSETELLAATSEQPLKMAKKYKFELDPFQKQSVACIEQEQSVLVAAHTSAGKTAVAEYAVAKSLKGGQRVIYTSPIKALSNQKYRDLVEGFQDVGLMTGDVTINPNASCLVMTTEILRSMLYRGSEVMREVAWVIFDEVHYMRDRDRGVVWEESIIMLPHKVKFVFLSATIPNAFEFAAWVAKVHDQPCHVVYTEYRPTPLEHYIFPAGGEGLHLVVDGDGNFREKSFQKAVSTLASTNLEQQLKDQAKSKSRRKQKKQAGDDLYRIIKMIMKREYNPVIVFSFSKKDCETNALALSKLNMNSSDESDLVEKVFKSALESLSEEDRKLPQIQAILPLLKRGIGIHHGGLLPILKEVIEILFGEGLLKCLFATETFAMGVNMPAKTVVFTSARKFDGKEFRFINSNEYVQMSGRAGRRNVDTRGIVIQMLDEKMEQTQIKRILKGFGDPLQSSFHLGYNMLLNLLRVEDSDPEFMMRHSLHQFQKEIQVPKLEGEVEKLQLEVSEIKFPDNMEAPTEDYCRMLDQIEEQKKTMIKVSSMPDFATPFLQLGRLIRVVENEEDWGLGVVISFCAASEHPVVQAKDRNNTNTMIEVVGAEIGCSDSDFIVDVALRCQRLQGATSMTLMTRPRPCNNSGGGEIRVVPVLLQCIREISAIRINVPKDLTRRDKLQSVWKSVR
jgi:ATP-dependent RNA helicase DOB1